MRSGERVMRVVWYLLLILLFLVPSTLGAERVRVGIYDNPPKVFLDDAGDPAGIFVDIAQEISIAEGLDIEFVFGTWNEGLERLAVGSIDVMVDVAYSESRGERFTFGSTYVLESWLEAYVLKGTSIRAVSEFAGRRVGVLSGSVQEDFLKNDLTALYGIDITVLSYPDYESSLDALLHGQIDILVATRFFGFSRSPVLKQVESTHIIFRPSGLYFAFSKTTPERIVAAFDRQLTIMKNDGASLYYQALETWLEVETRVVLPKYLFWLLSVLVCLLVFAGIFTLILRREVKHRTREISISEDRWRSYITNAPYGIFVLDLKGKLIQVNPEIARIAGYKEDDLIGHNVLSLLRYESREDWLRLLAETAVKGRSEVTVSSRQIGVDIVWWRVRTVSISGERILGFAEDITLLLKEESKVKDLQVQLVQAQKLDSIGRLAGGVAHDFNNMLSIIIGHTELAQGILEEENPVKEDLEAIHDAADRSAALTRQLLTFAHQQPALPKEILLNGAVEHSLDMLRRLIGEHISIQWKPCSADTSILIDPSQIDQILTNLCVNARDAIEGSGTITIGTKQMELDDIDGDLSLDLLSGTYILLEVSDTGVGMDKHVQERIFEPFFTTKEEGKGTGLGMASVYGIVKQNRGAIHLYSEVGKGTTFRIYFPIADDLSPEEIDPDTPEEMDEVIDANTDPAIETILLVEDESSILLVAKNILERIGYTVIAARSPDEAVKLARANPGTIDLLISDMIMPEMHGNQLANLLKRYLPDIRCLFMSGYTAEMIESEGYLTKGELFIQKPFTRRMLANAVRQALRSTP